MSEKSGSLKKQMFLQKPYCPGAGKSRNNHVGKISRPKNWSSTVLIKLLRIHEKNKLLESGTYFNEAA